MKQMAMIGGGMPTPALTELGRRGRVAAGEGMAPADDGGEGMKALRSWRLMHVVFWKVFKGRQECLPHRFILDGGWGRCVACALGSQAGYRLMLRSTEATGGPPVPPRGTGRMPVIRWGAMFLVWLLVCLLGGVSALAGPGVGEAFGRGASQLRFLAAGDLLFDRWPDRVNPREDQEVHNRVVGKLFARGDSAEELAGLLKDKDPKVRTLAVAALNHLNDPKELPLLVPLCRDYAQTLPHPGLVASLPGQERDVTPLEPQMVADFPRAILKQYLEAAGFDSLKQFDAYWSARKDRAVCASWLKVALERAMQGAAKVPAGREGLVQQVRERVEKLSKADRAWTMLYLSCGDGPLFDEAACLAAAKSLGGEGLMHCLAGHCGSADPDLHPAEAGAVDPADGINLWILKHAKELLAPAQADGVLGLERGIPADPAFHPLHTPWYAIAAAHLAPGRSKVILEDAFKRFPKVGWVDAWARADLAIALWHEQGGVETAFLVDWFYGETLQDEGVPHSRCKFLLSLDPKTPETRKLVFALVMDGRFGRMDWSSLKTVVPMINGWIKAPVITEGEMAKLQHPYGEEHVVRYPAFAAKTYPEQTAEVSKVLEGWRGRVRGSVGEWSQ